MCEIVEKVSIITKMLNGIIKGFCWVCMKLHLMSIEKYDALKQKQEAIKKAGAYTVKCLEKCISDLKAMSNFSDDFAIIANHLKEKKVSDALVVLKALREKQAFTDEVKKAVEEMKTLLAELKSIASAIRCKNYSQIDELVKD